MSDRLMTYPLGQTALADELPHLLGYRADFTDHDQDVVGAKPVLSGMTITALWVKNDSGGTVYAGQVLTWKAGYAGTRTNTVCGALGKGAGVVDPYVGSAGVADGKHFWLIIKGPCDLQTSGSAISAGTAVMTAASGRVEAYTSGSEQAVARCGIAIGTSAASAGAKFRAVVDFPF